MKRFAFILSLVIGAWMFSPTPAAQAWSWSSGGDNGRAGQKYKKYRKHKKHKKHKKPHAQVPELDPSAAGGAMVLLLGGMAYIASRRREEDLV